MLAVEGGRCTCERRVTKPLRDTVYQQVQVHRYQCLRCKRTFRVYPEGTTHAQTEAPSQRAGRDAVSAGVKLWGDLLSESVLLGSPSVRAGSMMRCRRRLAAYLGSSESRCLRG